MRHTQEIIKKLRDDASGAYDALVKEAKTLAMEIKSLENNLANSSPTPAEFQEECARIEEDDLQVSWARVTAAGMIGPVLKNPYPKQKE